MKRIMAGSSANFLNSGAQISVSSNFRHLNYIAFGEQAHKMPESSSSRLTKVPLPPLFDGIRGAILPLCHFFRLRGSNCFSN